MSDPVLAVVSARAGPPGTWAGRVAPWELRTLDPETTGAPDLVARSAAVLVDGELADPVAAGRRVHRLDSAVQIVIVAPEQRHTEMERAVLLATGLGEVWVVPPERLGPGLAERAAAVTAQRRAYRATRRRLGTLSVDPSAPVLPRGRITDAYLAALLHIVPDAILSVDVDGTVLSANPAAERMLTGGRLGPGRSVEEVVGPVDAGKLRRLLDTADTGVTRSEIRYATAEGEERLAEVAVSAVEAGERRVRAVVLRDVTEERTARLTLEAQAEALEARTADLAARNARLAALAAEREATLGQIVDGVIITDAEGRITFVNGAARRIHGQAELGVGPDAYSEAYHLFTLKGEPYPPERLPLTRALRDEVTVVGEEWLVRRPDGTEIVAQGSATPIFGPSGTKLGAVLTVRDVTEARRMAAEKDELLEARDTALHDVQHLLASRSRFYASMSHELRTPINAVLGYNDLLLAGIYGPLNEEQRQGVERAQRAARHLHELVNDVLDLSKIEAGKMDVDLEEVDLEELVEDVVSTIRPVAQERGSEIRLSTRACPRSVATDPRRVRQILINLLSNAAKFGAGAPVDVHCEGGDDRLVVSVRDRGPGIPAQELERIFEEFVQLDEEGLSGTGLGLSISRRLAELLGGTVRAESEPGEGSTFVLDLPLRVEE